MKKLFLLAPAATMLLCIVSCSGRKDYDINDGLNTEITLFSDEISVPIGTLGPVTLEKLIPKLETTIPGDIRIDVD